MVFTTVNRTSNAPEEEQNDCSVYIVLGRGRQSYTSPVDRMEHFVLVLLNSWHPDNGQQHMTDNDGHSLLRLYQGLAKKISPT